VILAASGLRCKQNPVKKAKRAANCGLRLLFWYATGVRCNDFGV
jgi:hypothetical protein